MGDICTNLVCKQHKDANMCQITSIGAGEGTPCGKGKVNSIIVMCI
jgi:hypothetical protein